MRVYDLFFIYFSHTLVKELKECGIPAQVILDAAVG